MTCECQCCGRNFKIDLMIPDELWEKIKPEKGLLCGSCIMKRLETISDYDYWFLRKK